MVNFTKSQPAPASLAVEKVKGKNGKYNLKDVLDRLEKDFWNKCYICEQKAPISINVEHFKAHRGNFELMFDWNNLFWVCAHCNNTKQQRKVFDLLLNCTDDNHDVLNWISYKLMPIPHELVAIKAVKEDDTLVRNTVALLTAVYNGTTHHKEKEAANLRRLIQKELLTFIQLLMDYEDNAIDEELQSYARKQIKKSLRIDAPFMAFKYWAIKENPKYSKEFQNLLPT